MSSTTEAVAYFVDPEELPFLVRGWPEEMRLAVCLDVDGDCELVIYHVDEEGEILTRVAQVLRRATGSFAVIPEVEGYPSRKLVFSEVAELLSLVRGAEGLEEMASDYAINYNFARDEGLDPQAVMTAPPEWAEPGVTEDSPEDAAELADERGPDRANARKIFVTQGRRGRSDLPPGYTPAAPGASPEAHVALGEISRQGARLRLGFGSGPLPEWPEHAAEIAFRDDYAAFFLPRAALPEGWAPGAAVVIDMPGDLFPADWLSACRHPRPARVAVTPGGIFIEPRLGEAAEQAPEAAPQPAAPSATAPSAPRAERGPRRGAGGKGGIIKRPMLAAGLSFAVIGSSALGLFIGETLAPGAGTAIPERLAASEIAAPVTPRALPQTSEPDLLAVLSAPRDVRAD